MAAFLQPEPRSTKRTLAVLQSHFAYLSPRFSRGKATGGATEDFAGEYQMILEQELFDFVLYEVPWIVD